MPIFQQSAIGLDISDHSVEAVLVVRQADLRVIASYGRTILEAGAVRDGEIVDEQKLARAVRKLLLDQMTPPLPKGLNRVAFALPETQVFMHIFEVPRLADERELGAALAVEADGYFPYPHEELAASYTVISQRPDKKEIYYAAVRKTVLDAYRRFFASVGLVPVSIEAESASIARTALDAVERNPAVLVDVGARVAAISVYDRDGILFSETLETAGDAFTKAVADALGMPLDEAADFKKERGVTQMPPDKGDRALIAAVDVLLQGVEDAIAYYETKSGRKVAKILFCGGSSMLPGLIERAARRLAPEGSERQVGMVDPWKSASPSPQLERLGLRERGPLIATALGLGLRGEKVRKFPEINFLTASSAPRGRLVAVEVPPPKTFKRGKIRVGKPQKLLALVAAGLLLVGALMLWYAISRAFAPPHPASSAPEPAASSSPASIALQDAVTLGPEFSAADKVLSATATSLLIRVSASFPHAATMTEGKAAGTVTVMNTTSSARALVATTRFLSQDGVLFRLDRAVTIPAGGQADAPVTADQPGAPGDIGPGRFTIPGLSAALQQQIYGVSSEAMRGGVRYSGDPYTQAEYDKAFADLRSIALAQAASQANAAFGPGFLAPEGLITLGDLQVDGAPAIGTPTGEYELVGQGQAQALALKNDEIAQILKQDLAQRLARPEEAAGYALGAVSVTVDRFDPATGEASLTLEAVAQRN